MAKQPRRLVIDANVVGSAGESEHPISSTCRTFLVTILQMTHHVVLTDEIQQEWNRHQSRYSSKWRTRMHARRRFHRSDTRRDESLRRRVSASVSAKNEDAAKKDAHLLEAAIATDKLVGSRDDHARFIFRDAAVHVQELKLIVWVNPTRCEESPVRWLLDGAQAEPQRRLGAVRAG